MLGYCFSYYSFRKISVNYNINIDENTSVPFVINWDSIINSGLINNNSKVAKLRSDNPITYETLYRKANYLSTVECFGFKKQAKTINTTV